MALSPEQIEKNWQLLEAQAASPLQQLQHPLLEDGGVKLWIKRDDQLQLATAEGDLAFCGNKWRKLKYNLLAQKKTPEYPTLTFGGAYSNHIAAVAAATRLFGLTSIGIIRGERAPTLSPTLELAIAHGMQLHFISRTTYRNKQSLAFQQELETQFGPYHLIPEGGTNALALKGVKELAQELNELPFNIDYLACAVGTGGTLAGLIEGIHPTTQIEGFASLKGNFLETEVRQLLQAFSERKTYSNWCINSDYHFGGYAKWDNTLIQFIQQFEVQFGIVLDPIYTGKLCFGIWEKLKKGHFPKGSNIVVLHTGGLQGIKGFNERFGTNLSTH